MRNVAAAITAARVDVVASIRCIVEERRTSGAAGLSPIVTSPIHSDSTSERVKNAGEALMDVVSSARHFDNSAAEGL